MKQPQNYPIGIPGQPWGIAHKRDWLGRQQVKREYRVEVIRKLGELREHFDVEHYGALRPLPGKYPLLIVKSREWDANKANILITGGVHGYETSGVQGALRFLETHALNYTAYFNILVAPCVSPWGYETINRWNYQTVDPNRAFSADIRDCNAEEAAMLMIYVKDLAVDITAHFDLHETTDTDNSEFRPAKAARDGITQDNWNIPDGFYLVGDSEKPAADFQQAIIQGVEKITHIAPTDQNDQLIGVPTEQFGVINYQAAKLGLCMGFTNAPYVTTTEVYPDSPKVDDENCILAQVAAITSGLDYLIKTLALKADSE